MDRQVKFEFDEASMIKAEEVIDAMSPEEIDAELRKAGYDPDVVARESRILAETCLENVRLRAERDDLAAKLEAAQVELHELRIRAGLGERRTERMIMKPKPQPKRELTIVSAGGMETGGIIHFRCASDDAREWARSECEQFGRLYDDRGLWILIVHAEYNTREVADYLDSYNDDDEPPT